MYVYIYIYMYMYIYACLDSQSNIKRSEGTKTVSTRNVVLFGLLFKAG